MMTITNYDWVLLLVLLILITGDKVTTYLCVQGVTNNYPTTDPMSIEKNPMAKWLINIFGNFWGNTIMAGCSLAIMWLILLGCKLFFIKIGHPQYLTTVIYCLIIILTFAIGNNTYYALKYNKVI